MSVNLQDLTQNAITALATLNAELDRQQKAWAQSRFGKSFRGNGPQIADHLHIELLSEMVHFDEDATGTLAELRFQDELASEQAA